jgi:eukaryotic-like serine/threonine-protein kinase
LATTIPVDKTPLPADPSGEPSRNGGEPCPQAELIVAWASGHREREAGGDEVGSLESHLASCEHCREFAADLAVALSMRAQGSSARAEADPTDLSSPLAGVGPNSAQSLMIGDTVAGRYCVDGFLGAGGMGQVIEAHHLALGHPVALKVLRADGPFARERFLREARACARLVHRHLTRVFDFGTLPDGRPYLVMERLQGEDLSHWIARGPVSSERASHWLIQACAGLSAAHAAGIVHRDIKPANLFLTQDDNGQDLIKLLDFGIAKIQEPGQISPALTQTQTIMGSPCYMSPEQLRSSRSADERSDVWSLGVVLYELLTGRRPFAASSGPALVAAIAADTPDTLPSSIGQQLEAIVLRCLEKSPAARFGSVDELALALQAAVEGKNAHRNAPVTPSAKPIGPAERLDTAVVSSAGTGPAVRLDQRAGRQVAAKLRWLLLIAAVLAIATAAWRHALTTASRHSGPNANTAALTPTPTAHDELPALPSEQQIAEQEAVPLSIRATEPSAEQPAAEHAAGVPVRLDGPAKQPPPAPTHRVESPHSSSKIQRKSSLAGSSEVIEKQQY